MKKIFFSFILLYNNKNNKFFIWFFKDVVSNNGRIMKFIIFYKILYEIRHCWVGYQLFQENFFPVFYSFFSSKTAITILMNKNISGNT